MPLLSPGCLLLLLLFTAQVTLNVALDGCIVPTSTGGARVDYAHLVGARTYCYWFSTHPATLHRLTDSLFSAAQQTRKGFLLPLSIPHAPHAPCLPASVPPCLCTTRPNRPTSTQRCCGVLTNSLGKLTSTLQLLLPLLSVCVTKPPHPPPHPPTHTHKQVVLDNFLDESTRQGLLDTLTGPGWPGGPHPPESLWEQRTADAAGAAATWGLQGAVLAGLASGQAAAKLEVQTRLCKL